MKIDPKEEISLERGIEILERAERLRQELQEKLDTYTGQAHGPVGQRMYLSLGQISARLEVLEQEIYTLRQNILAYENVEDGEDVTGFKPTPHRIRILKAAFNIGLDQLDD